MPFSVAPSTASTVTAPAVGYANTGDAKSGFQATDHDGWILLNGRLKTALTSTQQAKATVLGIGSNLPNATGRALIQGTLFAEIGSSAITQANLPVVDLTTTAAGGAHSHTYTAADGSTTAGVGTGSRLAGEISIRTASRSTAGTGNHAHTNIALNPVAGGQTAYIPAAIGVNHFIFLGA